MVSLMKGEIVMAHPSKLGRGIPLPFSDCADCELTLQGTLISQVEFDEIRLKENVP